MMASSLFFEISTKDGLANYLASPEDVVLQYTPSAPYQYQLKGTTLVEGEPAVAFPVIVMDRRLLKAMHAALTDAEGNWEILSNVKYENRSLLIFTKDDVQGTHNAQIYDYVTQKDLNPVVVEEATGGE